ncbi:unnamed protein product [Parnassius apollo]|uniref:(apollo) hypothetical protein n=1 Tax=Parnassius apollo TaxID=110799 RepID=A0A8S3WJU7_PARAO|nr:unnamed protein product [Parnassius apollo]
MKQNSNLQIIGQNIILVPYKEYHVPKYHNWMKSEELQKLTASEPLTLEEEYKMQKSWQEDDDKCTFVILDKNALCEQNSSEIDAMIGDTNIFITNKEKMLGEIEIMIAEKTARGNITIEESTEGSSSSDESKHSDRPVPLYMAVEVNTLHILASTATTPHLPSEEKTVEPPEFSYSASVEHEDYESFNSEFKSQQDTELSCDIEFTTCESYKEWQIGDILLEDYPLSLDDLTQASFLGATDSLTDSTLTLGPHEPCSYDDAMHYSFDFAQQVHLPHSSQQIGPLYFFFFLTGFKVCLFGVAVEPLKNQDVEVKSEEDVGVKYANRCEVCKILATELQSRLEETGKVHDVIEIGYSLDDVQPKKEN